MVLLLAADLIRLMAALLRTGLLIEINGDGNKMFL